MPRPEHVEHRLQLTDAVAEPGLRGLAAAPAFGRANVGARRAGDEARREDADQARRGSEANSHRSERILPVEMPVNLPVKRVVSMLEWSQRRSST